MRNKEGLQPGQVVDTLGELLSSLSAFAAKIPAASRMTLPGGVKPTEEAVEASATGSSGVSSHAIAAIKYRCSASNAALTRGLPAIAANTDVDVIGYCLIGEVCCKAARVKRTNIALVVCRRSASSQRVILGA